MERLVKVLAAAVLVAPVAAMAAEKGPMGSVALYATKLTADIPALSATGTEEGDDTGFGVKGWMSFGVPFVHFEYQMAEPGDDVNTVKLDHTGIRLGGGAAFGVSDQVLLLGKLEYLMQDWGNNFGLDLDLDGFGVHAGAIFMPMPALHFGLTVGFLQLSGGDPTVNSQGDTDGIEYTIGAGYNFTKQWGAFLDYRQFDGEIDPVAAGGGNPDWNINDIRLGATFSW